MRNIVALKTPDQGMSLSSLKDLNLEGGALLDWRSGLVEV
jgi:hypothetical protein